MTREAVIEGYERFLTDAIERTAEEFSLSRALRNGTTTAAGGIVDSLLKNAGPVRRRVVEPELAAYRERSLEQFEIFLDYVESDDDIRAYREALVAAGAFENAIREGLPRERREEVLEYMLGRYRRFGEALVPLVESPEAAFWAAATDALTAPEAHDLVENHFRYTQPLREYPNAFRMSVRIRPTDVLGPFGALAAGSVEVEYTEEAIRSTALAEEVIIEETKREIDARFGDSV